MTLKSALGYLDKLLFRSHDGRTQRPVKAYACYVLALGGRPNASSVCGFQTLCKVSWIFTTVPMIGFQFMTGPI